MARTPHPSSQAFQSLQGRQTPELLVEYPGTHQDGENLLQLADSLNASLLPWQRWDLLAINARREDGRWLHRTCVIVCTRQNGKTYGMLWLILYRTLVLGQSVLFTAHRWETAMKIWEQLNDIISITPWLKKLVTRSGCSQGRGYFRFKNSGEVEFTTRSAGGGRGLSKIDVTIYDEAFDLTDAEIAATAFLRKAAKDPQTIYVTSAVHRDFIQHQNGEVVSSVRRRALEGKPGIYLAEYAAPKDMDPEDEATWKASNPSYGVLCDAQAFLDIMDSMDTEAGRVNFGVEALGWGLWFGDADHAGHTYVVRPEQLDALVPNVTVTGLRTALTVDASPDGDKLTMALGVLTNDIAHPVYAGVLYHGSFHLPTVMEKVMAAIDAYNPELIVIDPKSPAIAVAEKLDAAGLEVKLINLTDVQAAFHIFMRHVKDETVLIEPHESFAPALEKATTREGVNGATAWARTSGVICNLVAVTNAVWAAEQITPPEYVPDKAYAAPESVTRDSGGENHTAPVNDNFGIETNIMTLAF